MSSTRTTASGPFTTTEDKTIYNVRSSVLGGAVVTELDDAGNKSRTHVFLGGGEIAEQVVENSTSNVVWRHTDPVTGSHSSIASDGHGFDDGSESGEFNAELEPLGESIPAEDPADDFFDLPFPYKNGGSVSQSNSEFSCYLDGMLMDDMKSCTDTLVHGAGFIDQNHSSPEALISLGITPIWEQRRIPGSNTADPPANADPDGTYRVTSYGTEDTYEWYISGYHILGDPIRIPKDIVDKIRIQFLKIVTPACMDEISRVFAETQRLTKGTSNEDQAISTNPVKLFDMVREQGGFYIGDVTNASGTTTVSTGSGAVGKGNATVVLSSNLATPPYSVEELRLLAFSSLGEIVHMAGSKESSYVYGAFSDVNLAIASHSLGRGPKLDPPQPGVPAGLLLTQYPGDAKVDPYHDTYSQWSRYNHDAIDQFCKLNP